jgi:hypothetical protein
MNEDTNNIAPVIDAPVVDAPAEAEAPVVQEDSNVPVGLMLDNTTEAGEETPALEENEPAVVAEEPVAVAEPVPVDTPALAEPTPEVVDPGEFVPNDYSFDIKLADGSTVKISAPEDIEALGADVEFASAGDLIKTQANYTRMLTGIENDKKAYDAEKSVFDSYQETTQQQEQFISGVESGMNYLESSGSLPPVPKQYENADWTDPKIAAQPGVKERVALIEYMAAENAKRQKAGVQPISSVLDAYNSMEMDNIRKANIVKTDAAKVATKARGAMVGGETSQSQGGANIPDNMIVGVGGNIRDITYRT